MAAGGAEVLMVTFRVYRYNPEENRDPYYDEYTVPVDPSTTVLEGLFYILENLDPTLSWRCSCRAAVCGSCGMKINGKYGLACRTLVKNLKSNLVVLEPLAHLPVIKDLVVDMTEFYEKYEVIEPYLMPKELTGDREFRQSPQERKELDGLVECILCGSCYAACTMCHWDSDFPGPFAILAADARLRDGRDREGRERLLSLISESGIWRCHTELRCTDVCPKKLSPTEAINHLKREAVLYPFFSSKDGELKRREKQLKRDGKDAPGRSMSRRDFITLLLIGFISLATVVFAGIFSFPLLRRRIRGWKRGWFAAGPLPEVKVGRPVEIAYTRKKWEGAKLRSYPQKSYLVKSKSGDLYAIDPTCTHLGCMCFWDDSIRMFMCPCHGGAFDVNGRVVLGPPPRPLRRLEVRIADGKLYLRDEEEEGVS